MKQVVNQKKKEKKQLEKYEKKSKARDIWRLVIENTQAKVGFFQNVMSNHLDALLDFFNKTYFFLSLTAYFICI